MKSFVAAWLAILLVAAGGGAALIGTGVPAPTGSEDPETGPRDVDVAATHDDGTVTVAVTSDGAGVENVTVDADDERVGTTGADGSVTFETNASEELELELEKGDFEGTVEYQFQDGSLTLVEEKYEYSEVGDDSDEEARDDEDDSDEGDGAVESEERAGAVESEERAGDDEQAGVEAGDREGEQDDD